MIFRKSKMLERLTAQGLREQVTPEAEKIMDNLDGCETTASCWRRVVFGEPVLWCVGKDGNGEYVNENDCE